MRPFLFRYHISFYYFFALKVVRGNDFWTHLEMCWWIFDLLPLMWNNGTVNDEMRSEVALMPVVIKFSTTD